MKYNKIRYFALALVITATFLAGCSLVPSAISLPGRLTNQQPATPEMSAQEILTQSQAAMLNLNTFSFTIETRIKSGILGVTAKGEGVYQAPASAHMYLSALGQKIEILLSESSGILVKLPGSSSWSQLTPDVAAQIGGNPDIRAQIRVAEYATSPTVIGEETVDGVDCYVIAYKVNVNKFFELNPSLSSVADPASTTGDGKAWVGKGDLLLHKLLLESMTNVQETQLDLRMTIQFNGFNQPVVIPSPN